MTYRIEELPSDSGRDESDSKIRALLDRPEIDTIHAHNAAAGCFAAKIVRD